MWQLAVDLGTAATVATLARDGAPAQLMEIEGTPAMPSGVYAEPDGRLLVGLDARRRAEHDPSRYEPYPLLRIPETNLLLAGRVVPVADALAALLGRVAGEVRQRLGAEADQILLSTPAYWSALDTQVLQQAATAVWGYGAAQLVSGGQAAGAYCAVQSAMPLGYPFAVYDLGAGGLSCAVLVATPEAVRVLATAGAAGVGGVAADAALIEHLGRQVSGRDPAAWQGMVRPSDLAGRRAGLALQRTAQQAREQLSTLTQVSIELPAPFGPVPLTREELQGLLGGQLEHTVGVLLRALADARLVPGQLAGVYLLGGLARMPMVAELVGSRFRLLGERQDAAVPLGAPLTVLAPPTDVSAPVPAAAVLPVPTWQPRADGDLARPVGEPVPHATTGRGSRRALAVAAGVAVLVVLLVAGITVVALKTGSAGTDPIAAGASESGTTETVTPAPSRSRRTAPAPTSPRRPAPSAPTSVPPPPVVTGWQTVAVPSRGAAYDVPPGWRVASQDTIGGFEPKSGVPVVGKGYATFGEKFCDKYDAKAVTVMTNSKQADPAAGALELATKWATVAFSNDATGMVPPLQIGLPQAVQTTSGATGTLVQVSAPVDKKQACSVPAASMYALTLPPLTLPNSASGSVALMVYVARDVPDEVSAAVIQQIVRSVRPL